MAQYLHGCGGHHGDSKRKNRTIACKLCFFVHHNQLGALEAWLSCGIDPDAYDYDGRTALHIAMEHENNKAEAILKKYNATGDIIDRWGQAADSDKKARASQLQRHHSLYEIADDTYTSLFNVRPVSSIKLDKDLLVLSILHLSESTDEQRVTALLPSLTCSMICLEDVHLLSQLIYKGVDITAVDY